MHWISARVGFVRSGARLAPDGTVDLVVMPENGGELGVELGLQWSGCGAETRVHVKQPMNVPLEVPACATGRLTVAFLNDAFVDGKDRNVFLRVRD